MKVSSVGDLGDCVYLLCILKQLPGGPHDLCLRASESTKAKGPEGVKRLYDAVAPLALRQSYIRSVTIIDQDTPVDWRSEDFRKRHYTKGETLMRAHLNHLVATHGIGQGFTGRDPWLEVDPDPRSKGRIVVNRTGRYRNDSFPWGGIVAYYRHRLLFVGLPHEWKEFCGHFGYVEHVPTNDMLDVARLVAGSDLFIGNQSCAYACAEGMKHNTIQETHLTFPDCIYLRPNAQFVADGNLLLPGNVRLVPVSPVVKDRRTVETPPKSWQYPGYPPCPVFDLIVREVSKAEGLDKEDAANRVYMHNVERCPDFFRDHGKDREMIRYRAAIEGNP